MNMHYAYECFRIFSYWSSIIRYKSRCTLSVYVGTTKVFSHENIIESFDYRETFHWLFYLYVKIMSYILTAKKCLPSGFSKGLLITGCDRKHEKHKSNCAFMKNKKPFTLLLELLPLWRIKSRYWWKTTKDMKHRILQIFGFNNYSIFIQNFQYGYIFIIKYLLLSGEICLYIL